MRALFLLVPVALMAQTSSPQAQVPAQKPATAKPAPVRPAAAKPRPAAAPTLTTDDEKTIYALGLSVYQSLSPFNLSPHELEIVKRALNDAAAGKPAEDLAAWGPKIDPLAQARTAAATAAYVAKAAAAPGAIRTPSGIIYRDLRPGTGPSPRPTDTVKVNYRGTFVNGTEFDSSYKRNEPAQFVLNKVIPCWTEGVQKMRTGGKAMLVCPSNLAYGDNGSPPAIPGGATLIFEIELLDVLGANP